MFYVALGTLGTLVGSLSGGTAAFAQNSVTLYGKIDTGITYVSNEGGSANYRADDSKMYGNRWGLLGSEDLGGGLKAVFRLENGFALNTGQLKQGGAEFGRQAYVGLSSDFGTLLFGNQYDFTNDFILQYNVSAYATGYSIHQGDFDRVGGDRLQNAVKYTSPDLKGLSFGGMYSFSNRAGDFHNGSSWSAGVNYAHGPFAASVAYTRLNQPSGLAALDPYGAIGVTTFLGQTVATRDPVTGAVTDLYASTPFNVDSQGTLGVGASYTLGKLMLMGNFTDTTFKGYGQSSSMKVYEAGGVYNFTEALFGVLGYQYTTFEGHHWNSISAGATYALSKRTSVYAGADFLVASSGVDANIGYNFTPSSSQHQSMARIGMFHSF
ncbi:porin [Paraburkholderia pallida]|uniref:Porin n=1 Tax=Paraburkholderia pallida TaxID=2547399 RepID=A0A4P7D0L1_9BURK|nr:porin [Paraburkholderia pallida]QBR00647.1 porin [Paraburkholderia pallida]